MYQSIASLTIALDKSPGSLFERANFPPLGTKKVRSPDPWGRKVGKNPTPGQLCSKIQQKKHKT